MNSAEQLRNELHDLLTLFYSESKQLGSFVWQAADQCPVEYGQMLDHDNHMTVTVEKRHGCPVDVEVLAKVESSDSYARKILLRRKSDNRVVQFGIVRLYFDAVSETIRKKIMQGELPLGRILIENNVLRQVQLHGLWRIDCGQELAQQFGVREGHVTYGRTALIYCNHRPGVELLEIVAPEDSF